MAAVGLYLMGWAGIPRSEVYAIGQDRATANVLFGDAVAMCRAPIPGAEDDSDTLEQRGEVVIRGEGDNAWKIEHIETGSKFRALANVRPCRGCAPPPCSPTRSTSSRPTARSRPGAGPSPRCRRRLDAARHQHAVDLTDRRTEYSEFFQKVARGEVRDDEAFAFVARVDKADRETVFENEACWPKALPALGITFPVENVRGEVNTARQLLSTALSVKRLYFGIPIGATEFWIAEEAWSAVQGAVNPPRSRGARAGSPSTCRRRTT